MQDQIQAIQAKVQDCIALAEHKLAIKMPHIQVRFDLRGRAAGMAGVINRLSGQQFYLRFNINHIRLGGKTFEHLLNDTVPHEVAHTVCQAFPQFGHNHNAGWQRVCVALGGNGRRTYSEDDAPEAIAAQRPYVYITTLGHEVRVTKVLHTKIQQGAAYSFRGGQGSVNRQCQFNYMTAPAVAASKKPVVVIAPVTKSVGASKADQLRAYLKQARADVGSEAFEQTVRWAVTTLGMSTSLARTYVKNNWSKV